MEVVIGFIGGGALVALVLLLIHRPTPPAEATVDPVDSALESLRATIEKLTKAQSDTSGELQGTRGELRGILETMARSQSQVAQEQGKLSQALRRPGVRGQWGEVTLRNVVESAGLAHHVDFDTQLHVRGENGDGAIRPDLVIRLPGGGGVPVDAKAPLDAFLDAVGAESPESQDAALDRHVQAIRGKVRELSAKAYWERFDRAPEMVVMFVASEAAFAAAVERDPRLLEEAARARVAIATPATMLALLQVVALGWREEALSENAEQVRKLATELVKRIEVLSTHLSGVGKALSQAADAHNKAVGSYETRLLVSARQLAEFGIAGAGELSEPEQSTRVIRQPAQPTVPGLEESAV